MRLRRPAPVVPLPANNHHTLTRATPRLFGPGPGAARFHLSRHGSTFHPVFSTRSQESYPGCRTEAAAPKSRQPRFLKPAIFLETDRGRTVSDGPATGPCCRHSGPRPKRLHTRHIAGHTQDDSLRRTIPLPRRIPPQHSHRFAEEMPKAKAAAEGGRGRRSTESQAAAMMAWYAL